jgi:hypothetical protein
MDKNLGVVRPSVDVSHQRTSVKSLSKLLSVGRFSLQVLLIYGISRFLTPALLLGVIRIFHIKASWCFFYTVVLPMAAALGMLAGIFSLRRTIREARYVWLLPLFILLVAFLFVSPGIYATILWESELTPALAFWFGPIFHTFSSGHHPSLDLGRAYWQTRVTAPAYAGAMYSLGACIAARFRFQKS